MIESGAFVKLKEIKAGTMQSLTQAKANEA